jgi:hypothetical protein
MAVWPPELGWLAGEPVFSVDDTRFTWGDVLLAAEVCGTVAELTELARHALACSRALSEAGTPPQLDDVSAAATRFRYERDLLSAEELDAWLARWHLELSDWTGYLHRVLSVATFGGELGDAGGPAEGGELSAAVAADAICSGMLEREAARFAADAALARSLAAGGLDRRVLIAQIGGEASEARQALEAAADVEREIGVRALEWTRIDAELLELADADAAREAALCVRVDGRPLADVAADIGVTVEPRALYLEEAEQERLTELLGAAPGELVGPFARDGVFLLVHVHSRTRPSVADPELQRRATSYLVQHATQRAIESRVRWA